MNEASSHSELDGFRRQFIRVNRRVDGRGNSHHLVAMPAAPVPAKSSARTKIVGRYDVAADAKKRISLRGARAKYFHVKAFANGSYLLEPRVLVPPQAVSARTLKMLDQSVAQLQRGLASAPINLAAFDAK